MEDLIPVKTIAASLCHMLAPRRLSPLPPNTSPLRAIRSAAAIFWKAAG